MHLVVDEFAQAGFALHIEARTHPRERVCPGLGPMRLDYAIPMTYDEKFNDGDGRFQFGVGWNRDL